MFIWLKLLRVYQWPKNILLFAAPFFGGKLNDEIVVGKCSVAFIIFSLVASAIYIFNDIRDLKRDKIHPVKKHRPIASGAISPRTGICAAAILTCLGVTASFYLFSLEFSFTLISYMIINICYSLYFKNIIPLDVFCVSSGYLFRILAGGYASSVTVSPWLFLTGFWVALYITFSKRLSDLQLIKRNPEETRTSGVKLPYHKYEEKLLFGSAIISAANCLMTYGIYTLRQGDSLVLTIIPASYGIIRYMVIVASGKSGDPLQVFVQDLQIMISSIFFLGIIGWLLYFR